MLKDLVKQSRSYRSFDPAVKITQEQLLEFCRRRPPDPFHHQFAGHQIQAGQRPPRWNPWWSAPPWPPPCALWCSPPKGHHPAAFIVVCIDTAIAKNPTPFLKMWASPPRPSLLCAAEAGPGGCMVGNFQPEGHPGGAGPLGGNPSLFVHLPGQAG